MTANSSTTAEIIAVICGSALHHLRMFECHASCFKTCEMVQVLIFFLVLPVRSINYIINVSFLRDNWYKIM